MADFYDVYNQDYIEVAKRTERYPRFKIEFLDYSETVIGELINDISASEAGNIVNTYNQGVRRKCSFTVIDTTGKYLINENSPFWYHRKFKLYDGLYDIDKGNTYWFSQGVFFTIGVSVDKNKLSISGCDKFGLFTSDGGNSTLEGEYQIDKDTNINNAIIDTLLLDNGNGKPIDCVTPIIDIRLRNIKVPYDISVSGGGYIGDILIELATCLGADIYYDANGHLRVDKGTSDYFYSTKAPQWEFGSNDNIYIGSTVDYDFQSVINRITVCGDNTEGEVFSYTAENHNPSSPTRIEIIGYRNGDTITTPAGFSNQSCKDYAEYYLEQKTMLATSISITTPLIPHFDVDKIITLTDRHYRYEKQRFIVTEVEVSLGVDVMNIKACNVASLPYITEMN